MSFDQRVREGMDRLSEDVDPDVAARYDATRTRGRRLRRRRRAIGALAVAAVVVATVVGGPSAWHALHSRTSRPALAPVAPFPIPPGSYATRISRDEALEAGVPRRRIEGFAGSYVFTFAPDGSYIWEEFTPNPFIKDGGGGIATHDGHRLVFTDWLHAASGDDVAVRVVVAPEGLVFSELRATPAEAEPFARALFTSDPWTPTG
jgi:hypothetical protein